MRVLPGSPARVGWKMSSWRNLMRSNRCSGLFPYVYQHDGMAREELHPGLGLGQLDRSLFDVADRSAHGSPIHEIAG